MKKIMQLMVLALFTSAFGVRGEAKAAQLNLVPDPASSLLSMSNEQAAGYDQQYQKTMEVVTNLRMGLPETLERISAAREYSETVLEKIGTAKRRKKFASPVMSRTNDQILAAMYSLHKSDLYPARHLSVQIKIRLRSFLEFLAGRHAEFLETLNRTSSP